jgi:hypothetical protein
MGRFFSRVAALSGIGALVAVGAVLASGGSRPQIDQPEATVIFTHQKGKLRECEGQDGHYFEDTTELVGTSTGDSRLSGAVKVEYREIVNETQETGPQQGQIVIRDAKSGERKAIGEFNNAGPLEFTQGVIVGHVRGPGSGSEEEGRGEGKLIANWRVLYGENGSVSAQIGGEAADNRLPTNLWSGECEGKFEEFEDDLPAPDSASAQSVASRRKPGR